MKLNIISVSTSIFVQLGGKFPQNLKLKYSIKVFFWLRKNTWTGSGSWHLYSQHWEDRDRGRHISEAEASLIQESLHRKTLPQKTNEKQTMKKGKEKERKEKKQRIYFHFISLIEIIKQCHNNCSLHKIFKVYEN